MPGGVREAMTPRTESLQALRVAFPVHCLCALQRNRKDPEEEKARGATPPGVVATGAEIMSIGKEASLHEGL